MIITSRSNPHVKLARGLSENQARRSSGLALIEGPRDVYAAAETKMAFRYLIYDPDRIPPDTIDQLADAVDTSDLDVLSVSPDVFSSISRQNNPSGLAAIVHQRWAELDSLTLSIGMYCIALYSIRDPGNLGTIIRSAEAVSSQGVILIDASTDPYHPMALRAGAGSLYYQKIIRTTLDNFIQWKLSRQLQVVGASQSASDDYRNFKYPDPTVLLMGSERSGLPDSHPDLPDQTVRIPMSGRTESLNVSISASLLLYELFNRKRNRDAPPGV